MTETSELEERIYGAIHRIFLLAGAGAKGYGDKEAAHIMNPFIELTAKENQKVVENIKKEADAFKGEELSKFAYWLIADSWVFKEKTRAEIRLTVIRELFKEVIPVEFVREEIVNYYEPQRRKKLGEMTRLGVFLEELDIICNAPRNLDERNLPAYIAMMDNFSRRPTAIRRINEILGNPNSGELCKKHYKEIISILGKEPEKEEWENAGDKHRKKYVIGPEKIGEWTSKAGEDGIQELIAYCQRLEFFRKEKRNLCLAAIRGAGKTAEDYFVKLLETGDEDKTRIVVNYFETNPNKRMFIALLKNLSSSKVWRDLLFIIVEEKELNFPELETKDFSFLVDMIEKSGEWKTQERGLTLLALIPGNETIPCLLNCLGKEADLARLASEILGGNKTVTLTEAQVWQARDISLDENMPEENRLCALKVFCRYDELGAQPKLIRLLGSKNDKIAKEAADYLEKIGKKDMIEPLSLASQDDQKTCGHRLNAFKAMVRLAANFKKDEGFEWTVKNSVIRAAALGTKAMQIEGFRAIYVLRHNVSFGDSAITSLARPHLEGEDEELFDAAMACCHKMRLFIKMEISREKIAGFVERGLKSADLVRLEAALDAITARGLIEFLPNSLRLFNTSEGVFNDKIISILQAFPEEAVRCLSMERLNGRISQGDWQEVIGKIRLYLCEADGRVETTPRPGDVGSTIRGMRILGGSAVQSILRVQ